MNEENRIAEAPRLRDWRQHKFMLLVGLTIFVSLVLVVISLQLYNSSGAAQLDLSRPGYKDVRDKANHSGEFAGFPASGPIDKEALDEFRKLYDEKLEEATEIDSFGGDVLSDRALGIGTSTGE